mmetsp:Transcript_6819/g.21148  ORF Transcript_6819/g.21148 Transcript_6819/m.21148 type:complete len:214 (+) Transcript_6819:807-1448(+)
MFIYSKKLQPEVERVEVVREGGVVAIRPRDVVAKDREEFLLVVVATPHRSGVPRDGEVRFLGGRGAYGGETVRREVAGEVAEESLLVVGQEHEEVAGVVQESPGGVRQVSQRQFALVRCARLFRTLRCDGSVREEGRVGDDDVVPLVAAVPLDVGFVDAETIAPRRVAEVLGALLRGLGRDFHGVHNVGRELLGQHQREQPRPGADVQHPARP